MRDKTHDEFIERWAAFVKEHPTEWQKYQDEFIDAQFQMAEEFMEKLVQLPDGKKRLMDAYGIKNVKGYPRLLG